VTPGKALRSGPARKSPIWRGASLLIGWGLLLFVLFGWILSPWVDVPGLTRIVLILIGLGILLSIPYGLSWLRGDADESGDLPRPALPEVHTTGEGTTVVVMPPVTSLRGPRIRELGVFAYLSWAIFYRAPLVVGDFLLTGLWNLIGAIRRRLDDRYRPTPPGGWGRRYEDSQSTLDLDTPPDQRTF
jgi:hypothetical protein